MVCPSQPIMAQIRAYSNTVLLGSYCTPEFIYEVLFRERVFVKMVFRTGSR